ncbi:MAG: DUF992 domain-containing protein [Hyphomonadaceae bacterium]|nr:DUF992 domain-containing protein [Hyphomonadaceae bacterium]
MARRSQIRALLLLTVGWAWTAALGFAAQKSITAPDERMQELGTLTCILIGEGEGTSTATGRGILCEFRPGLDGPEETYIGSVQGVGQAELLFGKGAVLLSVKGPASTTLTPGWLTQAYAVDAGASGGAPAPLIGEKNRQIVLQPLAEQEGRVAEGKTQPDAVIILVELKLLSTPA